MMGFKVLSEDLFVKVSERGIPLYGTIPTNGVIFSDTDLTSKGATFIAGGDSTGQMVKAAGAASAQVSVSFNPSAAVSMGSSGSHNPSGFSQNLSGPSGTSDLVFNTLNSGNHTHTISNAYSGATDYLKYQMGMFSMTGSRFIPTGGWIFAASKPDTYFTDPGTTSSFMAIASTTGAIGTTSGSSSSQSWNVVTSASATHTHGPASTSTASLTGIGNKAASQSADGSHTHTVTINGSWSISNRAYIQAWKSTADIAPIVSGTIIGWNSTSTSLPPGWYFCDGGTYNGFTTVNFNRGVHLWPASGSHGSITTGTDSFTLSGFNDVTNGNQFFTPSVTAHSHTLTRTTGAADMGTANYTTATYYHGSFSWTSVYHNHVTSAPSAYTGGPASYSMPLIIYLP